MNNGLARIMRVKIVAEWLHLGLDLLAPVLAAVLAGSMGAGSPATIDYGPMLLPIVTVSVLLVLDYAGLRSHRRAEHSRCVSFVVVHGLLVLTVLVAQLLTLPAEFRARALITAAMLAADIWALVIAQRVRRLPQEYQAPG